MDIEDITWQGTDKYFFSSIEKYFKSEHSEWVEYFSIRQESGHVMFFFISTQWNTKPVIFHCKKCNLWCNHSNDEPFAHEDDMVFSHVKISCFCPKATQKWLRMHLCIKHWYFVREKRGLNYSFFLFSAGIESESVYPLCRVVINKSLFFVVILWRSKDGYFYSTFISVLLLNCGLVWSALRHQMSRKPSPKKHFFNWVVLFHKVRADQFRWLQSVHSKTDQSSNPAVIWSFKCRSTVCVTVS